MAERLRQAAVEGRIEPDELEQRLHTAFRARTYGELNRLVVDLPPKPVRWERPQRQVAPAAGRALVLVARTVVALVILAAIVTVAVMSLAWWMIGLVIWLAVSSSRHGCRSRHAWHRPPHVRRVSPRRL